jgi:hypothetical protein
MIGAAGERIVAFARAGKPSARAFLRAGWWRAPRLRKAGNFRSTATVPKAWPDRDIASGVIEMVAAAKKREIRKSVQQPGWITLEGGFAARPCVVQDLSSTGAKVTIDDANVLPGRLRLAFSRDARTGRSCEVVWRRGKTVGIKFVR